MRVAVHAQMSFVSNSAKQNGHSTVFFSQETGTTRLHLLQTPANFPQLFIQLSHVLPASFIQSQVGQYHDLNFTVELSQAKDDKTGLLIRRLVILGDATGFLFSAISLLASSFILVLKSTLSALFTVLISLVSDP